MPSAKPDGPVSRSLSYPGSSPHAKTDHIPVRHSLHSHAFSTVRNTARPWFKPRAGQCLLTVEKCMRMQ